MDGAAGRRSLTDIFEPPRERLVAGVPEQRGVAGAEAAVDCAEKVCSLVSMADV